MTVNPTPPPPPPTAPTVPTRSGFHGRRFAIGFGIVLAVVTVYALSLVGVHLLARSAPPLPPVDFSQHSADDTIVQVRLSEVKTVANRLMVNVLVYPKDSL